MLGNSAYVCGRTTLSHGFGSSPLWQACVVNDKFKLKLIRLLARRPSKRIPSRPPLESNPEHASLDACPMRSPSLPSGLRPPGAYDLWRKRAATYCLAVVRWVR